MSTARALYLCKRPWAISDSQAASTPERTAPIPTANEPDLASAEGRRRAFNALLDPLVKPAAEGGRGLSTNAAISELSNDPAAKKLFKAMGGKDVDWTPEPAADFSCPKKRAQHFHARVDMLMRPKADGSPGMTLDEAIAEMKRSQMDAPLLRAMSAFD